MKQLAKISTAVTMLALASVASADLNRVGPANNPAPPGNGFPIWYQDLNGMVLDLCLPKVTAVQDPLLTQETACLLAGPTPPYVFPTNFPDEVFFHRVVSNPVALPGGKKALLVLALEAAFASGAPAIGQQAVFSRIRVTAGVPFDGTYTVTHPYGTETFSNIIAGVGNRDIVFTEDVGTAPGIFTDALSSRVGPFLQHVEDTQIDPATGVAFVPFPGGPAAQPLVLPFDEVTGFIPNVSRYFLGDGVTPRYITGSPFNTNWFEICGPFDGPGLPDTCYRENLFTVTGMLHDPTVPVGSPLSVTRATFSRNDAASQVDVMARASKSPGQVNGPKLTAAGHSVAPVLLAGPTTLGDWYAQGIPVPSIDVPTQITVTNSNDVPPTSIVSHVVDEVVVKSASYDASTGTLTVVATSSDKGDITVSPTIPPAALSLAGYPTATATVSTVDRAEVTFVAAAGPVPPAFVRVASSKGGQGIADTTVANAPAYPAGVPYAGDDTAEVVQNTVAAIPINVLANDTGAGINPATLTIVAPAPVIGTASVLNGQIFYRAPTVTGNAVIRYTVANGVGVSNVGTVNVAVTADPNGPVPSAVADPTAGAINVTAGQSVVINVLANDSANGGTLNPASVTVTTAPSTGTTSVNPTTGAITYTATTAGTRTFQYRVSNLPSTNGTVQTSAPATVTVTVAAAENLTIRAPGNCSLPNKWRLSGTSNVSAGNTITIYRGSVVGGTVIGTAPVVNGAWQFQGTAACSTPISIQSTLGTKVQNVVVQVK